MSHLTPRQRVSHSQSGQKGYFQSTNNSIDKTTAASSLPGTTRDCRANRRRQTPFLAFTHLTRSIHMLPATTGAASTNAPTDTPVFAQFGGVA